MSRADAAAADDPDATPETAALREDIEQTRTEMSGTIDAIQDRLDPEVLSEQAKDTAQEVADRAIAQAKEAVQEVADRAIPQAKEAVQEVADRAIPQAKEAVREVTDHAIAQTKEAIREVTAQTGAALRGATIGKVEDMARYAGDTAGGWRHSLVETVKAHPIPAALAGLTLGYLFLNRESGPPAWEPRRGGVPAARAPGYRATGSGAAGVYGPGAYDAQRGQPSSQPSLSERAGDLAGQAQEAAGQVADQAQERVGQAVDTGAGDRRPGGRDRSRRRPGRWPTRCRSRPPGRRASWAGSWRRTPSPSAPSPSCWGPPWGPPSAPRPPRTATWGRPGTG